MQGGADSLRAGRGRPAGGQQEGGGGRLQHWDQGRARGQWKHFSKSSTPCKKQKLFHLYFLFGPEISYKYWTHWFYHVEVIRTTKSKLVF